MGRSGESRGRARAEGHAVGPLGRAGQSRSSSPGRITDITLITRLNGSDLFTRTTFLTGPPQEPPLRRPRPAGRTRAFRGLRAMHRPRWFAAFPVACLVLALGGQVAHAQGPIFSGAGPVNRSMGGASTAAPLDATGTLYWNPAGISGLSSSELDLGLELFYPRSTLSSSIPAGALGPGFPPVTLAGRTRDEVGVFALPTRGFVYRPECSGWTFGLGLFPVSGFGVNYPGDPANPIIAPPPNGLGHVSSLYQLFQLTPTVTYQVTDRLSVGLAGIVDIARLEANPGLFLSPDDANADGVSSYPAATSTRNAWGGGFQVGVYYVASDAWRFGAA